MSSTNELTKSLRKWLQDANLASHSIDSLISNGYNEIDAFICSSEDDIEQIANNLNIPRLDKLQLKLAIKKYKNNNNTAKISNTSTIPSPQHVQVSSSNHEQNGNERLKIENDSRSLQNKYTQLENKYNQQVNINETLQENINDLNESLKVNEEKLNSYIEINEENAKIREIIIEELEQGNDKLTNQISTLENEKNNQIIKLKSDQQQLQTQCGFLQQQRTDLQQKAVKLCNDYNALNEKYSELKHKNKILTDTRNESDLKQEENKLLEEKYNVLNDKHSKLEQKHKSLNDNHNTLNGKHGILKKQNNILTNKYDELKAEYDELKNSDEILQVNQVHLKQIISELKLQLKNATQHENKNQLNDSVLKPKMEQLPKQVADLLGISQKSVPSATLTSLNNVKRIHKIAPITKNQRNFKCNEQKNSDCMNKNTKKRALDQPNDNEPKLKKLKLTLRKRSQHENINKLAMSIDNNSNIQQSMAPFVACKSSKTHKRVSEQMNKAGKPFAFEYHICVHCHICRQHFVEYDAYMSHVQKHYIDDPKKTWTQCDLGCESETLFCNSHIFIGHISRHTNDKAFKCEFPKCTAAYGTKQGMKDHWTRHIMNKVVNYSNDNKSKHKLQNSFNKNAQRSLGRIPKIVQSPNILNSRRLMNVNKNMNGNDSDDEPIVKKGNRKKQSNMKIPKRSLLTANSPMINRKVNGNKHKQVWKKTKIIGLNSKRPRYKNNSNARKNHETIYSRYRNTNTHGNTNMGNSNHKNKSY